MKFTINRERILGLAEDLLVVIPSRIVTTATSGFLLEVDPEGAFRMYSTDLTFTMEARSTVESTDGRLRVVIPAQRFVNALRYMTGETIEVVSQGWTHNVQMTDGTSNIRLSVISEDFPNVAFGDDNKRVCEVDSSWLRTAITQLEFAAEKNDKLHLAMNSILIDCKNSNTDASLNGCTVVAGRGSIICRRKADDYTACSRENYSFILPRTAIKVIKTALKGSSTCTIGGNASGTRMIVEADNFSASMPLKAATYPNYVSMFNRKADCLTKESVNRDDLKMALLRATVVLPTQDNEASPIQLALNEARIELNMSSSAGSFQESVPANKEGPSLDLMFNLKLFSDSIGVCSDECVDISGSTSSGPVFLTSSDTEIIIMPQVRNRE